VALTDSLISAYELDEASGDAVDSHGGLTLTEFSSVTTGTGHVHATARDFELDNEEYFLRADGSEHSTGDIDFTIEAWVNSESNPASLNHARVIVSKDNNDTAAAANVEFALYVWDDRKVYFDVSNGSTIGEAGTTGTVDAGTGWHHLRLLQRWRI
jgi:hypothetical protein